MFMTPSFIISLFDALTRHDYNDSERMHSVSQSHFYWKHTVKLKAYILCLEKIIHLHLNTQRTVNQ